MFNANRFCQTLAFLFCGAIAGSAPAATFLVGTGAGCNFNTIQAGINAAAANPGADVVRISNATTWGPAGVTIGQQDVTLDGRFATCTDSVANGNYAQLVGNAVNPDSRPAMISVTGSGVRRLIGLQIRNNVRGLNSGGGAIAYSGSGELILSETDLRDNRAQSGGAISSTGGIVTLSNRVLIENNIADLSGGGISLAGGVLFVVGSDLSIAGNEAYRIGGGLIVGGSAQAYIASAGFGSSAVLQSNRAGISFNGGVNSGGAIGIGFSLGAKVVVYSTNANAPTRIADNLARDKGGAVYLADSLSGESATVCLMDVHLTGNRANGGAALYADVADDTNSSMVYNVPTASECSVPANAPAPPVRCNRTAIGCNTIDGHIAQLPGGGPSGGGVVTVNKNLALKMRNAKLVDNTAGFVISATDAAQVELNTALIAANTVASSVVRLGFALSNQGLVMRNVTIGGNTFTGASGNPSIMLDTAPAAVGFNNNLIFQPGRTALVSTFGLANANYDWRYNATNAPQTLPNPEQALLSDARFENPAVDDYRLRIGSEAVNSFAAGPAIDANLDLDGRSRPVELSILAPELSRDDLGAFERQEGDIWLVNGSFSVAAQLRYWEPSANGEAIPGVTWDAQDAVGNPNSGSALVNLPDSLAPRLTVLRRCFNVPAPGRYTITAKAQRGSGLNADEAKLSWRFRANDATCTAAEVQGSGEVAFFIGSLFQPLAAPLAIDLPSTTSNSTIEIRLDAVSGLNLNGLTNIRFDDIVITGTPLRPDGIFASSYE